MAIEIKKNANEVTIAVTGRLDTITAPVLEKTIGDNVSVTQSLILDMNGLEYISSAGLRVLLATQKKLLNTGSMKLINVCEAIMDVFEMTGFADILVIE